MELTNIKAIKTILNVSLEDLTECIQKVSDICTKYQDYSCSRGFWKLQLHIRNLSIPDKHPWQIHIYQFLTNSLLSVINSFTNPWQSSANSWNPWQSSANPWNPWQSHLLIHEIPDKVICQFLINSFSNVWKTHLPIFHQLHRSLLKHSFNDPDKFIKKILIT